MPTIVKGQCFPTLQDFKNAFREWAVEKNFTPAILDSDTHRVRAGCRSSPNCPFRIRANFLEKRGCVKVTTCDDVHTCISSSGVLTNQEIKRAETSKLTFLLEAIPKLITVDSQTTTKAIMDAIEQKYGQKIALRQAQKVKKRLAPTPSDGSCKHCGQSNHAYRRCPERRRPTGIQTQNQHSLDIHLEEDGGSMQIDSPHDTTTSQDASMGGANVQESVNAQNITISGLERPSNGVSLPTTQSVVNMDPGLLNGHQTFAPSTGTRLVPSTLAEQMTHQSTTLTPQDTRMEAARLMQRAAWLMGEAAKLNAEAARVIASVAHS
ncbi:hypothetical protein MMC06_004995 [Schaereria dolodes]|nr:hypothetical protein [Schaereria dolodes]